MRWVWCALELHRSAFGSMDTRWNLTDWDIMELILELGQWRTCIGRWRHLCPDWQWHRRHWHMHHTVVWQYKLSTYCTSCAQVYGWFQRVTTDRVTRHRYCCPLSVFMLLFFEVVQLLVVERHFITSTWTHWTKDCPHCLAGLFGKCVCFWLLLCRWGTIRGTRWKITGWR